MSALRAGLVVVLLIDPRAARAHVPIEGIGGFWAGLLHPALTPAHLMALMALGLLLAQQAPGNRPALGVIFAASLVTGLASTVTVYTAPGAALVLLGGAAVSGALVAAARPVWLPIGAALATTSGVAIGLDSRPEDVLLHTALLMLVGTASGAGLLAVASAAIATVAKPRWLRIAVRIVGSWIAASAALVLALELVRSRAP